MPGRGRLQKELSHDWVRVGIVNLGLFILKAWISVEIGSVAVAADAVDTLGDVITAGISISGFVIAGRPADPEHPYGHGRVA